jgi:hypothetical protein
MPRIVSLLPWWLALPLLRATLLAQAGVQEPDAAATAAAVRAALLHKIAGYVAIEAAKDGPKDGQHGQQPPAALTYRIGFVGTDATVTSAQKTLPGKSVRGATVEVVTVAVEDAVAGRAAAQCDLLYIAAGVGAETVAKIVAKQADKPVPLVCDQPGFAAAGGGVQLFVKDGGMRFEVNSEALKRQGLHASAQLLKHSQKGPKR